MGIATNAATTQIVSGSLNRQSISEATLLSAVKGGQGITTLGDITVTDTAGVKRTIDLDTKDTQATTVGDVISRINSSTLGVESRINDAGDGIILVAQPREAGKSPSRIVAAPSQRISTSGHQRRGRYRRHSDAGDHGTTVKSLEIEADDTLADVVTKINALNGGVTASILNDGQAPRLR